MDSLMNMMRTEIYRSISSDITDGSLPRIKSIVGIKPLLVLLVFRRKRNWDQCVHLPLVSATSHLGQTQTYQSRTLDLFLMLEMSFDVRPKCLKYIRYQHQYHFLMIELGLTELFSISNKYRIAIVPLV